MDSLIRSIIIIITDIYKVCMRLCELNGKKYSKVLLTNFFSKVKSFIIDFLLEKALIIFLYPKKKEY